MYSVLKSLQFSNTKSLISQLQFKPVRNTKGFVLYFLMRKYTLVPYIGGISVWYK